MAFLPLSGHAGTLQKLTAPAKFSCEWRQSDIGCVCWRLIRRRQAGRPTRRGSVDHGSSAGTDQDSWQQPRFCGGLKSVGVTSKTHSIVVPAEVTIVREAQTVTAADISQRVKDEFLPGLPWKDVRLERIDLTETILASKGEDGMDLQLSSGHRLCQAVLSEHQLQRERRSGEAGLFENGALCARTGCGDAH